MSSLQFVLRKIDETRDYLLQVINHNNLMREKYKKTCKYLNYIEHLFILALTVTGCVSISALLHEFVFLLELRVLQWEKNCAITVEIKTYKSINQL